MIGNRHQILYRTAPALALAGLVLVSSATGLLAQAKTPDQYFNSGANRYIDDEIESAKQIVEEGLEQYRNDPKLNAVKKLLEQQEQEDQKDQEQQEQDQKQDQEDKQDQKDQDEKQDQEEQQNQESQDSQEDQDEREQEREPTPEEISKEEAEMLLDAMEQDEKAAREKMRLMLGRPQKVEKDW